jgi:outer membrane biosynthesis protein TonB
VLGSVSLHAALLTLPLGGALKGPRAAIESAGGVIRAFLRPEAPERTPAPEPVVVAKPKPAPTEIEPPPRMEPVKPPAPGAVRGGSTNAAAIAATFFDPAQLTEKPRLLTEPRLDLLQPMLGRAGMAKLILYIDETGSVDRVEVEAASLSPEAVARAKVIFAALRFSPGRFDGAPVKTRVRITVGAEENKDGS